MIHLRKGNSGVTGQDIQEELRDVGGNTKHGMGRLNS